MKFAKNITLNQSLLRKINANLLPCRKNRSWNKLFLIGPLKTGTTSLKTALEVMGYRTPSSGIYTIGNNKIRLDSLTKDCIDGNYQNLKILCEHFDFFVDDAFGLGKNWIILDALFPNSKFIFTHRDPAKWFDSWVNFWNIKLKIDIHAMAGNQALLRRALGPERCAWVEHYFLQNGSTSDWSLLFDKTHFCKMYLERMEEIIFYFRNRHASLLTISIADQKDVRLITNFLDLPRKVQFSMPHSYKTSEIKHVDGLQLREFAKLKRKQTFLKFISAELLE